MTVTDEYVWRIFDTHNKFFMCAGANDRSMWMRPQYAKSHAKRMNVHRRTHHPKLKGYEVQKFKLVRVDD